MGIYKIILQKKSLYFLDLKLCIRGDKYVSLLKELHESYIDIRALSYDELAASLPELSARADEINVKIFAQCSGS